MTDHALQKQNDWAAAAVDVLEGKDEYLVFADVPGAGNDDVTIRYHEGELRLEGDYRRVFTVGPDVDPERISAELENGVLKVHLPKKEAAKPRTIQIKAG
jgi:HSP20 family molecular chaperone IbpA